MDSSIHLSGLLSRHDDEATRTSTSEGLEEGEVEGETLLIVESEDQASVDLSHDQSGDSLNSDEGDISWMEEQLSYFCDKCQKWIPASQLREQLSYLKGDNFFRFTCSDCSADGKEQYERLKLTWQQEKDFDVVEHSSRLPQRGKSCLFPFRCSGIWRAWMVETCS